MLCVLNTIYFLGDQINNKMGWACSTCAEQREVHIELWWGDLMERNHSEHLDIGKVI